MSTAEQHSKSSQSGTNVDMGGPGFGENVSVTFSDTEDHINMSKDTIVTFNVGGVIFQTLESTLRYPKRPVSRLRSLHTLERHWDENNAMYFFDRDPTAFHAVLNYMRTGVLHLPHKICSPQITKELLYWGLPRIDIQPCCWKDYSFGVQSLENLVKLETDRQPAYINQKRTSVVGPTDNSRIGRCNHAIWMFISDPSSSKGAKMYSFVSLTMVVSSILSFSLRTLPQIATKMDDPEEIKKVWEASISAPHVPSLVELVYVADLSCFAFFLVELMVTFTVCPDKLGFVTSSWGIIDFTAILPDIFNTIFMAIILFSEGNEDLELTHMTGMLLILRVLRLFRLFRLIRRLPGLMIIVYTMCASFRDLMSTLLVVCFACLTFASFAYFLEDGNPDFRTIPDSCWWAIVTMTTVGYGDVHPRSTQGKVLGACCALSGVLVLGVSVPTLVQNFVNYFYLFRYVQEKEARFLGQEIKRDQLHDTVYQIHGLRNH